MLLDHVTADGETETKTAFLRSGAALAEAVEDVRKDRRSRQSVAIAEASSPGPIPPYAAATMTASMYGGVV